jgi:hypothetical protein
MKKRYIVFILAVVVVSVLASWEIPLRTTEEVIPMSLNVTGASSREVGFAINQEGLKKLDFGTTFPGTTVIKTVNITRGTEPPAYVSISLEGNIAPWVTVSECDFLLKDQKQVTVGVNVPFDANEGYYSGNIRIIYEKTAFSLLLT